MNFFEKYFKSLLYIQISPQRLTVRNPISGISVSDLPRIAYVRGPKSRIIGVGREADLAHGVPDVRILNPFAHPRSLVSDFTAAELLIKEFVRRASAGMNFFRPAPTIVLHPLGDHEGGLTQIELRALTELALGAGGSQVVIYRGADLTDEQLKAGAFTATTV